MTEVTDADRALAAALLGLPGVLAVAIGGSRASGLADAASDTDLYAFGTGPAPDAAARAAALATLADGARVVRDATWGEEDHLHVGGRLVEVMYVDLDVLALESFYAPGAGPTGYTTAWLHTLAHARVVADPAGALAAVRARLEAYPEATRTRILAQAPVEFAGYLDQLRKAQARADWTAVTNRRSAFQAAWFDALFALNRRYHPGEKRLLRHAASCPRRPERTVERWAEASLARADDPGLEAALASLGADLLGLAASG